VFSVPASLEKIKSTASQLPELSLPSSFLGKPVAVAVSGGADSIYLLCALWANPVLRPNLLALHFDHAARGIESTQDALFVKEVCRALDVPCYHGRRTE
jgi:tRNA(Ile)-lysidine synthase TilS/MesJ